MIYMDSMASATFFAIVWGFAFGLASVSFQYALPHYFGTDCIATINSMFSTSAVIGSAIGPIAYGVAIDQVGSWSKILWSTVPIAFTCSLLLLFLAKKPVHPTAVRVSS